MKSRYISFEEWERAAELLDDKWAAIIYTGIYTGLRYSDLCQLTPRMILGPADRVIELVEKKTTRPRAIKLHKKLIMKLRKLNLPLDSPIVPYKNAVTFNIMFKRRLFDIGIRKNMLTGVSSHSLRKSFARRYFDMNGQTDAALFKLKEMLGHSTVLHTKIYIDLLSEDILDEYDSLNDDPDDE